VKNGDIASVGTVIKASPTSPKIPKAVVHDGSSPRVRVSYSLLSLLLVLYLMLPI
jgi:hypothetical protein